jgi:hypothetical protein
MATVSLGRSVVSIASRHHLLLTTPRQAEQGDGRRYLPGLRPPDHVGSQPPVRIRCAGSTRAQALSLTLRSRTATVAQAISSRSRRRSGGGRRRSAAYCGQPLGGDHVPRRYAGGRTFCYTGLDLWPLGSPRPHSPPGLASWQPGHGSMHARPVRDGKQQHGPAEWPPRSSTTRHGFAAGCRF